MIQDLQKAKLPLKCRFRGNHRTCFVTAERSLNVEPVGTSSDEQFSVAMAKLVALTLANICLDVQISICMYLHPSDILALRKVC